MSGLRSHLLLWAAILVLSAVPLSSQADNPPAKSTNQNELTSVCGATIEDNLSAAQKAFESTDAAMHAAFSCLLKATIALNTKLVIEKSGQQASAMLHAPVRSETGQSNKP